MAQTHDIEDVLSSIRRLVANETPDDHVAPAEVKPEGPTLVLAAEQRVTEPEDPFQMIRSLAQEERDGRDARHFTDAMSDDVGAITEDLTDAVPEEIETANWVAETSETPDLPEDYVEDTDYEGGVAADEAEDDGASALPGAETALPETEPDEDGADAAGDSGRADDLSDLSARNTGDDALRDLIAEVVRQELSGELGERITRNVRKLVRREIRQMLASEEFD